MASLRFTSANAAQMAALSHVKRRERKAAQAMAAQPPARLPANADYPAIRLVRVRAQLDKLDAMAITLTDTQKLDQLGRALSHWATQERELSMRPLPGQLRPKASRPAPSTEVEPL
jgi:hypothetical protein